VFLEHFLLNDTAVHMIYIYNVITYICIYRSLLKMEKLQERRNVLRGLYCVKHMKAAQLITKYAEESL
jgi:hypothetical protein